ncbi:reverse transcriptase domain-containing protein [Tanacetum coccineum]
MRTRSSSNLVGNSSSNPTTSNPKRRNRRRSKQPFSLEESPVVTMADQRTMAELLRAPTEGYAEAIVVPPILAEHFELKHSLINMMTSDQFFGLEKDNPHDHIRWFNKITSTIKYKDVPNSAIKLMLFPFSLAGAARRWLEKEPPRSILTWEDLEREIAESGKAKLTYAVTPPLAFVKVVEEICVTCGGAHLYYQCLAADDNTFPEYRDNIQGYVAAAAGNYNQGNSGYRPPGELKAITTRSGLVLDGPSVPMPPPFINPEEDERVEETLTDPELAKYTIKVYPSYSPPNNLDLLTGDFASVGIARDVFVSVGKFTFPADFVIVDYESDPRVPLILGRPFLRTARALIDVHGEEMILRDGDERLIFNMRHDTLSYSNQPHKESINMIDIYNFSHEEILKDLFATNCLSGNPTSSLTSHTDLTSLKSIYLHALSRNGVYSEDSVEKNSPDDNLVDTISEMFTNEHALDYSSPPLWDDYDDELFDHESVNDNTYDDPFDFKEEKIKDAKILIDELDPRIQ